MTWRADVVAEAAFGDHRECTIAWQGRGVRCFAHGLGVALRALWAPVARAHARARGNWCFVNGLGVTAGASGPPFCAAAALCDLARRLRARGSVW